MRGAPATTGEVVGRTDRELMARVWQRFGYRLLCMGRKRAGVRALRRSLALQETCWECWAVLADAEASLGHLGSAIVAYHRLLGLRPDLAPGWYNLALLYQRLGYPQEAADAFGRSLRVARKDHQFRAIIGLRTEQPGWQVPIRRAGHIFKTDPR